VRDGKATVDLFEYQGKQFFASFDIPVSKGRAVTSVDEAVAAAEEIGQYPVVVKAQVQVGGRGKAGGIKLADSAEEVRTHATNILGMDIKGHTVHVVWIEVASDIAEEYYASFTLDRSAKQHLGMLSAQGGVEIEAVAESDPDAIAKIWIDPVDGLSESVAREWVEAARLNPAATDGAVDILLKLYRAYTEGDADLVEINPLILKPTGEVHALDAKVTLDGNAAFRHEWADYEATQERDEREQAAHEADLQYVGLEGSVGIIANGAGLAMSTLDVVNQVGGSAANFLDVGGGADAGKFVAALTIIDNDPRVRSILINIFGGITRGEEVANGIVSALDQIDISAPIVIRLDGTNAEEGRAILEPHLGDGLQMQPTMLDAARKVVALAG
jgi:succinyl-CoA synthetase beta subunit